MRRYQLILLVALCCISECSCAFQLEHIDTRYERGEYHLDMTATLDAPLSKVEAILRDYAHYPDLDRRILAARANFVPDPGELQLFTRIRVCFSFFCRNVERLERLQERPGDLLATVIPEHSDAERGETHTTLTAQGERTQVQYTLFIVPKFWVPAVLGRLIMLRTLREGTVNLFQHVEGRARGAD